MSLLARWRTLWNAPSLGDFDDTRWVVVDVEASGLDAAHDRLLAIAATALRFDVKGRPRAVLGDSFEVVLKQDDHVSVDKANILLHGIGIGAQRAGAAPAEALNAWRHYLGRAPLVAYHSAFDATMIGRAMWEHLGTTLPNPWLDLEPLAAVLYADPRRRPLDHWLQRHGITCLARHNAAADALATAQLLLAMWPEVVRRRAHGHGFARVADLARGHRFIPGRR